MFPGLFPKIRGIDKWPVSSATVTEVEELSSGGRSGRTNRLRFVYGAGGNTESGTFVVDDNSSLYAVPAGEEFDIRYNPQNPSEYYCVEAGSLSQTVRKAIFLLMAAFAIFVLLVEFFGRK